MPCAAMEFPPSKAWEFVPLVVPREAQSEAVFACSQYRAEPTASGVRM